MAKKQKVRFHKGDRRPATSIVYRYSKKMIKKNGKIYWQAIEKPTKTILKTSFFEEDIDKLIKFQNKNQIWKDSGGVPKFLCEQQ
jgi:hypothetical protein